VRVESWDCVMDGRWCEGIGWELLGTEGELVVWGFV
jgi:hypothetical protein